jgi:signal transduction histidine kinase
LNIYQNKQIFKWFIVAVSLLIAGISVLYTHLLVRQLAEREMRQIDLFAKGQEAIVSPETSDGLTFLLTEIIEANQSIPVILTTENGTYIAHRNIDLPPNISEEDKHKFLKHKIEEMKQQNPPISIQLGKDWYQYIYYANSDLLTQLKYYPYIQLAVIGTLALLAYMIFSASRRAEQNRVWVGLAKETAHQLGTPLSSLLAWVEYFKADPEFDSSIAVEIEKDVERLLTVTARFSNIGSQPTLKPENIFEVIEHIVAYLRKRVSERVVITLHNRCSQPPIVPINIPLIEWTIENLCKNAIDAMNGVGSITIDCFMTNFPDKHQIVIDITDTGKGIPASKLKTVFNPGYTTKKRGWGLGLTLTKRIIEEYHKGKIFVKNSQPNVGTTFRIQLDMS